jgi:hypothetical protein
MCDLTIHISFLARFRKNQNATILKLTSSQALCTPKADSPPLEVVNLQSNSLPFVQKELLKLESLQALDVRENPLLEYAGGAGGCGRQELLDLQSHPFNVSLLGQISQDNLAHFFEPICRDESDQSDLLKVANLTAFSNKDYMQRLHREEREK